MQLSLLFLVRHFLPIPPSVSLATRHRLLLAPLYGDLPLAEQDTEMESSGRPGGVGHAAANDDDDPLPIADEFDDEAEWQLPQSSDLRDILSQMDDGKPGSRRREKE